MFERRSPSTWLPTNIHLSKFPRSNSSNWNDINEPYYTTYPVNRNKFCHLHGCSIWVRQTFMHSIITTYPTNRPKLYYTRLHHNLSLTDIQALHYLRYQNLPFWSTQAHSNAQAFKLDRHSCILLSQITLLLDTRFASLECTSIQVWQTFEY